MTVKSLVMGRRAFLGSVGLAAGAVVATSLVPLSVVHALPSGMPLSATPTGSSGDWHVDDICGHWPPYAHPIGYGQPAVGPAMGTASMRSHADPIDHIFLA